MSGDVSSRKRPERQWRLFVFLAACAVLLSVVASDLSDDPAQAPPAPAPPAATPPLPAASRRALRAAWLGLNYNSRASKIRLRNFAVRGIVYDREGSLEVAVGDTPTRDPGLRAGLHTTYAAGMIPDIVMDSDFGPTGCEDNPNPRENCLPVKQTDITRFVEGFVQTARSVLHRYPGKKVLFEPLDEPWNWASPPGTESGKLAATEYAAILAQLLSAAKANKIPLADVFVPATGTLNDGTSWIPDLYAARPCLKPGPASCGPIAGWNLHPYGLPHSSSEGIESVPGVRTEMLSGQNNIIVSELGFCAINVNGGHGCSANRADIDGTSSQTAAWLSETLQEAAVMHRAGWLKALLVWARNPDGWAMQNPDGSLTAQGRALDLFAGSSAGR